MKKLILAALIAAFTVTGCTNEEIEEDHEIQIIDKENYQNPRTKHDKGD